MRSGSLGNTYEVDDGLVHFCAARPWGHWGAALGSVRGRERLDDRTLQMMEL